MCRRGLRGRGGGECRGTRRRGALRSASGARARDGEVCEPRGVARGGGGGGRRAARLVAERNLAQGSIFCRKFGRKIAVLIGYNGKILRNFAIVNHRQNFPIRSII